MEGKLIKVLFRREGLNAAELCFRLKGLGYREECISLGMIHFAQRLANKETFGYAPINLTKSKLPKELFAYIHKLNLAKEEETIAALGRFTPRESVFVRIGKFFNRSKFERFKFWGKREEAE